MKGLFLILLLAVACKPGPDMERKYQARDVQSVIDNGVVVRKRGTDLCFVYFEVDPLNGNTNRCQIIYVPCTGSKP